MVEHTQEPALLRRRWSEEQITALGDQVTALSRVVRGPHQLASPWPATADGLIDLRGLPVGRLGLQVKHLTLERIDFTFATGWLSFFESEVADCRFDSVVLSIQPSFNRRFEQCTFRTSVARNLSLGPHVARCDFTDADLRKLLSSPNTWFEACSFDGADLAGAEFSDTVFSNCTFRNASFSERTSFTRCEFTSSPISFGSARVHHSTRDGNVLPDQWDGESRANAAWTAYLRQYTRAAAIGEADDLPLGPDDED